MKTPILALLFVALFTSQFWAQNNNPPPWTQDDDNKDNFIFTMGLPQEEDPYYDDMPVKARLTNDNYRAVGSKASVKKYAPTPQSQGNYGTCAAWATTYAARTILEAQRYGWTDKEKIGENVFAYGFVYRVTSSSSTCWGAYTSECIKNMRDIGVPKLSDYAVHCPQGNPPQSAYQAAEKHKIKGYATLWNDYSGFSEKQKVDAVKKSLSEGNPIAISMICPNSFYSPKGVWIPESNDNPKNNPNHAHGRHAMCVVGYDDNEYGGAFEIQNSWGASWGNEGYIWIKYSDFADFVYQAFELFKFETLNENKEVELAGKVRFQLDTGNDMQADLNRDKSYKMDRAYRSGTRFRLYISNNEPAFVYAFGSDLTNKTYQVFPHEKGISPALTYKANDVAIPSEDKHVRMDGTVGTDYLCVLYSKEPLNLDDIQQKVRQQSSRLSFKQKVEKALGEKLMKDSEVSYSSSSINFKGKSKDGRSVVALVVATEHID